MRVPQRRQISCVSESFTARCVRLITRGGNDWTQRYPLVVEAVNHLKVRSCLIDGEVVCCDEKGVTSVLRQGNEPQAFLYAFDLLESTARTFGESRLRCVRRRWRASFARADRGAPERTLGAPRGDVFQHACKMGWRESSRSDWDRVTDPAVSRLAQVQEPRSARGEAGGGGGLAMSNRRGPKGAPREGNRQRFLSRASLAASY